MKPAPVPWILCGPGLSGWPASVCEMTGESFGSTAMAWKDGLRALITSQQPVIVPPVPTAETRMSTLPSVSSQISSAVVLRWISGLAGFSNCCGIQASGVSLANCSALAMAPFHAFGAGRQHQLGAQHRQQRAPLQRHRLRHGQDELVAFGRRHERQRDAGIAAGRLDDHRVLLEHPALLGRLDHGHADAVLDAAQRVEELALEQDRGRRSGGDACSSEPGECVRRSRRCCCRCVP